MVRCCMCAMWAHVECIGKQEEYVPGIWPCFQCRLMPSTVASFAQSIGALTAMVESLTTAMGQLQSQHEAQCRSHEEFSASLRAENSALSKQVSEVSDMLRLKDWPRLPKPHATLLL